MADPTNGGRRVSKQASKHIYLSNDRLVGRGRENKNKENSERTFKAIQGPGHTVSGAFLRNPGHWNFTQAWHNDLIQTKVHTKPCWGHTFHSSHTVGRGLSTKSRPLEFYSDLTCQSWRNPGHWNFTQAWHNDLVQAKVHTKPCWGHTFHLDKGPSQFSILSWQTANALSGPSRVRLTL